MSYVFKCDVHFKGSQEQLVYCVKEPSADRMNKILGRFFESLGDIEMEVSF